MSKLISVVVPIYKVEDYLRRCVDSILGQTYANLEVILVDDGSPDGCGRICDEYKESDSRVIVVHKENDGVAAARNTGIDIATGELITFVDGDDWLHESCFQTLFDLMATRNADIAACAYQRAHSYTTALPPGEPLIHEYSNLAALDPDFLDLYSELVVPWGKLYKRELFQGIRFPKGKFLEDEFTTYKVIYRANKVVFTMAPLVFYFQRAGSFMAMGYHLPKQVAAFEAYEERSNFFMERGLVEFAHQNDRALLLRIVKMKKLVESKPDARKVQELRQQMKNLRQRLRKGEHKFRFRCFYELFFLMPETFTRVFQHIYGRRRKRSSAVQPAVAPG